MSWFGDRKWVSTKGDLPEEKHYAILYFTSRYIPSEGHGYPAGNEPAIEYVAFTSIEAWEAQIAKDVRESKSFMPIQVTPAKVSTKVEIKIS